MHNSRSIRTWILLSTLLLATCIAGALFAVVWFQTRTMTTNMDERDLTESSNRAEARLHQLLQAAELTVASAVRASSQANASPETWQELALRLIPAFEQRPELSALGFALAATGEEVLLRRTASGSLECVIYRNTDDQVRRKEIYTYASGTLLPLADLDWDNYDARRRSFFQKDPSKAKPGWSEFYSLIDQDGRPSGLGACYAHPLFKSDGGLLGFWHADFDSSSLCDFMRRLWTETGAVVYLSVSRPRGRDLLVAYPIMEALSQATENTDPALRLPQQALLSSSPQPSKEWSSKTIHLLPPYPEWNLVTQLPAGASAIKRMGARQGLLLWVALGSLGLVAVGSLLFAKRIARPVEALLAGIARYSEGTLSEIQLRHAPRELVSLARNFHLLMLAIQERREALLETNKVLGEEIRLRSESEALLAAVLANIPFELWVVDSAGRCILQNAAATAALGDIRGRHFREAAPARAEALDWKPSLARALAGEVIQRDSNLWENDKPIHLHAIFAPVQSGKEGISSVICVNIDITEQVDAEEALITSQRRLSLHLENTPLGVIDWSPEKQITAWNPAAELIFGWPASEALGRNITLITPEAAMRALMGPWEDLLQGKRATRYYSQNVTKDGRLIDCEWYNTAVCDPDGRVAGISSLILDVSERLRTEQLFQESEERFQKAFRRASLPQGIINLRNRTLMDVNDRWVETFGIQRRSALGRTPTELGIWSPTEEKRRELFHILDTQGELKDFETELVDVSGKANTFLVSITLVKLGSDPTMLVSLVDIHARKHAEQEVIRLNESLEARVRNRTEELAKANVKLQELDRLKSEFLATMSHELRTPLNSIIGFSSVLRQGMSGPLNEEQLGQITWVNDSAVHLLTLINDLLDVSRIEAGRMELFCETVDPGQVMAEVSRTLSPLVSNKGIQLVVENANPDLRLFSDRKRLFQVLLNLAGNAVKFTERGSVTLRLCAAEGGGARIEVRDTGIGIRADSLPRLFEAFRQVDGSAKRVYEGTGLGLYLVRKLLDLLGGEIAVASTFGQGSTFTLKLPAIAPETPRDTPSLWQASKSPLP